MRLIDGLVLASEKNGMAPKHIAIIVIIIAALIMGAVFLFSHPLAQMQIEHEQQEESLALISVGGVRFRAEIATTSDAQTKGLGGRTSLAQDQAILFVFKQAGLYSFWMKDTYFPLDIFWIKDGRIVALEGDVPPPDRNTPEESIPFYTPKEAADLVLETNAGVISRYGIKKGDPVTITFPPGYKGLASSTEPEARVRGAEYFIETLRNEPPKGGGFRIGRLLADEGSYRKFAVSYQSGAFTISGIMNVPSGPVPKNGFPVLILNHGLIPADRYYSGRGSRREQDFFARNGYVVLHPDYRGLASSTPDPAIHHDFYVGYTHDVVGAIDALKEAKPDFMDLERLGMWGHSMGGGIAARVMVLRPEVKAFVLFAPISADAEDNFYELTETEIAWLHREYGDAGSAVYKKISPFSYFDDVTAPVQLHHGNRDADVPIRFSEKMFDALRAGEKQVVLYRYPGEPHEFIDAWPVAAQRSLEFFNRYVKNIQPI